MTITLLQAESLTAGYGKRPILHDVTLRVEHGEIVAVIGPNGAGKSTAFKTIVGFLRPSSGRLRSTARTSRRCAPTRCWAAGWRTCPRAASCFRR